MTTARPRADAGELRAAIGELRTMGNSPRVRLALAEAEFRVAVLPGTRADEGIERLRSAVGLDPYLVKGFLHLGRLLHRAGRFREAIGEYVTALRLAPASRRLQLLLAQALLELDRDEQQAGEELIAALAERRPERLDAAVAAVHRLFTTDAPTDAAIEGKKAKPRKLPADLGTVWPVWLLVQLGRSAKRPQLAASMKAAAAEAATAGPTGFAVGCLLLLVAGEPPAQVRKLLATAKVHPAGGGADPALQALTAGLELAETSDPAAFVEAANQALASGALPLAAVCSLHFRQWGPSSDRPVAEALRLLDGYPAAVRAAGLFQELRIAILDGYARQAWDAGRPAVARLLWREALALDPYRMPVALNLALVAARMRAAEEYAPAWQRTLELTYLLAAGVSDVHFLLAERRDLHAALVRQVWRVHCGSTPPRETPPDEELDALVADADALEVWLREWDCYYVNARLSFRSPIHLLGVPRDVSPAELTAARDALVRQVGAAIGERGWAGAEVFRKLVADLADEAVAQTAETVDRARDLDFEREKERADALAQELVKRTLMLIALLRALVRAPADGIREGLADAVIRHQRTLPREILQGLFVNSGLLQNDLELAEVFEDRVIELAVAWSRKEPVTDADRERLAARLGELAAALPNRLALRALHCDAQYAAKQPLPAYRAAVAGLTAPCTDAPEDAAHFRARLIELIDQIGIDDVPARLREPSDHAAAERTIQVATRSLGKYPASAALRAFLASVHLALGGEAAQRQAAGLLIDGTIAALDEAQRARLEKVLTRVPRTIAADAVRVASERLRAAVPDRLRERGAPAVEAALREAGHCRELTRRYGVHGELAALDEVLARLRHIDRQRRDGEE